jgi:hypothetical protein
MVIKFYRTFFLLFTLLVFGSASYAGEVVFSGNDIFIGQSVDILEDSLGTMTFQQVRSSGRFVPNEEQTPNFGLSNSTFWIRFTLRNETKDPNIFFELANARIDFCTIYSEENGRCSN